MYDHEVDKGVGILPLLWLEYPDNVQNLLSFHLVNRVTGYTSSLSYLRSLKGEEPNAESVWKEGVTTGGHLIHRGG